MFFYGKIVIPFHCFSCKGKNSKVFTEDGKKAIVAVSKLSELDENEFRKYV